MHTIDHRILNIATIAGVFLASLGLLYALSGWLHKPEGVARRLLTGALFGLYMVVAEPIAVARFQFVNGLPLDWLAWGITGFVLGMLAVGGGQFADISDWFTFTLQYLGFSLAGLAALFFLFRNSWQETLTVAVALVAGFYWLLLIEPAIARMPEQRLKAVGYTLLFLGLTTQIMSVVLPLFQIQVV